ncbi:MAG TPA: hypothetical protein VFX51_19525 [Solirubrobacteraceae bacterium]|nr:hypothetical protein [Solirubrobacteraceae bacterium]
MRRALAALAIALVVPAGAAAADRYAVSRPIASVRSAPGSFAIGNVFAGARVDVVAARGQWVYAGWAPGRCGWLMARGLEPTGERTATACPPPESLTPQALFAPRTYQLGCGEGCVYPARVVRCTDRTAYANYDGAFRDPVGRERALRGTRGPTVPRYAGVRSGYSGFGVRYVTRDGAAALIKDSRAPGPVWRFVHAECIERLSLVVRSFRRPHAAVRALGSEWTGSRCLMRWARPAVTVAFRGCRRFAWAVFERQRIHGSALVHTVTTPIGLRLGDRVSRLRDLYPRARRFRGTYRLDAGLRAMVRGGRVGAFRVTPAG